MRTLFLVLSCLLSFSAVAQDEPKAKALARHAKLALEEGNYQDALQDYQELHLLTPSIATLVEIGRCYELLGDNLRALATYQQALAQYPDSLIRPSIEASIVRLETIESLAPSPPVSPRLLPIEPTMTEILEKAPPSRPSRTTLFYLGSALSLSSALALGGFSLAEHQFVELAIRQDGSVDEDDRARLTKAKTLAISADVLFLASATLFVIGKIQAHKTHP